MEGYLETGDVDVILTGLDLRASVDANAFSRSALVFQRGSQVWNSPPSRLKKARVTGSSCRPPAGLSRAIKVALVILHLASCATVSSLVW